MQDPYFVQLLQLMCIEELGSAQLMCIEELGIDMLREIAPHITRLNLCNTSGIIFNVHLVNVGRIRTEGKPPNIEFVHHHTKYYTEINDSFCKGYFFIMFYIKRN